MMVSVVTANVWNMCQNACPYCISHAPDHAPGCDEILDVDSLIRWLDKFKPDARVNVSGGEPLFYPGIEDWIWRLIDAGRKVLILTNGQAIPDRPRLHDAPISWIVTYHLECGLTPEEYAERIAPLKNREGVKLQTVLVMDDEDVRKCHHMEKVFEGFSFSHRWVDDDRRTVREMRIPKMEPLGNLASYWINLVENDGRVYPCNTKMGGPVGSVYDMTFDIEKAKLRDARSLQCQQGQWCGAVLVLNDFETDMQQVYKPKYTPHGMVF